MLFLSRFFSHYKSFKIYQGYFIRSQILEKLAHAPSCKEELINTVHKYIRDNQDDLLWTTSHAEISIELIALSRLGFITMLNNRYVLTDVGINANRTAMFHSMYASSLTTHRGLIIAFWGLITALLALAVAVASLLG
jgi:hypothetical protein